MSPQSFAALVETAVAHHRAGELAAAERGYALALAEEPRRADILHLRGLVAHQAGRDGDAARYLTLAHKIAPHVTIYRTNLAMIYDNLGLTLMKAGRAGEAAEVFAQATRLDPDLLVAYSNRATALMSLGALDVAESACQDALTRDTNFVPALHSLGCVLTARRELDGAEEAFVRVLQLEPEHARAMANLAAVLSASERFDEALAHLDHAIALDPNRAETHITRAQMLADMGRSDEAVAGLRTALVLDPDNVEAWYALAASGRIEMDPLTRERLAGRAEDGKVSRGARAKLHFTLAALAEKAADYPRAWRHFARGNALRASQLKAEGHVFDPQAHAALIDRLIAAPVVGGAGNAGEGLVFVVGLPRSGTTLVEQMLAAHPDAVGIGERDDLLLLASSERPDIGGYLARVKKARVVVDKTPFNYLHLGFIACALPGAKIVHIRRDLRDTGLSCFQQNFVQPHPWSCDLAQVGFYAAQYKRLMDHWRQVLPPGRMIEVDYERLVAEPEVEARRLVEFAGLQWDDSCLALEGAKGVVRSASKWQVRKPIYRSSAGRWRRYKDYLQPLLSGLSASDESR